MGVMIGGVTDDGRDWSEWAKAYRRLTGDSIAEMRVEPMRRDLLADVDRFVRSLE